MNKDTFEGHFKEISGKIREKWGKLTQDDLTQINGKREQLLGRLQQRYGYAKEQAERELNSFLGQFDWAKEENLVGSRSSRPAAERKQEGKTDRTSERRPENRSDSRPHGKPDSSHRDI